MALPTTAACLALATAVVGCSPGDEQPPPLEDDPALRRYASAVLPWPPRAFNDRTGGSGAKLFRNNYHRASVNDIGVMEHPTLLAALVALPTSLVAIYPPADADGLIIAHGGIDQPWERIPLVDIPYNDIGAVDAHATRDGGVVIGVRRRVAPQEIRLFSWRPGRAVESIPFTRPAPSPAHWTNERCEDLAIGVSAAGAIDVVFRQNRELTTESEKILHARRAPGQSAFVFQTVDETANFPQPPPGTRFDLGCRLRLAYYPNDAIALLAERRLLPDSAFTTLNPEITEPPRMSVNGYTFAAGAWTMGGPSADGGGGGATEKWWYTPQFDVAQHPAGYTVSGLNRDLTADPELTLLIDGETHLDGQSYGLDVDEGNDPQGFERLGSGGAIVIDECGGIRLWWTEPGVRKGFMDGPFSGTILYCGLARIAPVVRFTDDPWGFAQVPVVARGPRSYNAALCLMDQDRLAICTGGFDATHFQPGSIGDEADSPELVASTPPDGATTIPTSLSEVRVTLSRPVDDDEQITAEISDVHFGRDEFLPGPTPTGAPGELRLALPALRANTLYRISIAVFQLDKVTPYVIKKAPVIYFRTGP